MKRLPLFTGAAIIIAALIAATPAKAGPQTWSLEADSGFVFGGLNTSTTMNSPVFIANWGEPAFWGAVVTDSGAGNGALTDSIIISLQKYVDLGGYTALGADSSWWINIDALPAFDPTKAAGKTHYLSADSVSLGAYEVGGMMRFRVYKGGGQTLDTLNGDYTIKVFFEQKGKE